MMFHNDYQIDRFISQRQEEIRRASQQSRRPSAFRIRVGWALISLGERLRGCAPVPTTPTVTRRLHSRVRGFA